MFAKQKFTKILVKSGTVKTLELSLNLRRGQYQKSEKQQSQHDWSKVNKKLI